MRESKEYIALIYMFLWILTNICMVTYEVINGKYEKVNNIAIGFATTNVVLGTLLFVCFRLAHFSKVHEHAPNQNDVCYVVFSWAFGLFLGLASILCFSLGYDYAKEPEGIYLMVISGLMIVPAMLFVCTID